MIEFRPGRHLHVVGAKVHQPSGGAVGPVTLLHDTFTDVDGTLLAVHVPEIGGPWDNIGWPFEIISNNARVVAVSWGYQAVQFAIQDYSVECNCTLAGFTGEITGIYIRSAQAAAGFFMVGRTLNVNKFRIRNGNVGEVLAEANWIGGATAVITVEISGTTIRAWQGGVNELSYVAPGAINSDSCGIRGRNQTDLFHEITVTA